MHKKEILDQFGRRYMYFVRDTVLQQMMDIIDGTAKAPESKKISKKLGVIPKEHHNLIKSVVFDSVDHALHYFLFMFQEYEEDTKIMVEDDNGESHSLEELSDGLCGELYTEDGWIERFSKYSTPAPKDL